MNRVVLTKRGLARVLDGYIGQIFEIDHFTDSASFGPKAICHVRDYRYPQRPYGRRFQIWSLGVDDWAAL